MASSSRFPPAKTSAVPPSSSVPPPPNNSVPLSNNLKALFSGSFVWSREFGCMVWDVCAGQPPTSTQTFTMPKPAGAPPFAEAVKRISYSKSDSASAVHPSVTGKLPVPGDSRCFKCFKAGHYIKECTSAPSYRSCLRPGHVAKNCRLPKRPETEIHPLSSAAPKTNPSKSVSSSMKSPASKQLSSASSPPIPPLVKPLPSPALTPCLHVFGNMDLKESVIHSGSLTLQPFFVQPLAALSLSL